MQDYHELKASHLGYLGISRATLGYMGKPCLKKEVGEPRSVTQ